MYSSPRHITSSYNINDVGESLYNVVRNLKPKKIIDFGLLYGYSTICLAQAVKDNGFGEIIGYDLFEDYKYKNARMDVINMNLKFYGLNSYVTLKPMDFDVWLDLKEDFDLLHLDISNDGETIEKISNSYPHKPILFEGGTPERDEIEWMKKYNKTPIFPKQTSIPYQIFQNKYPGLSGINIDINACK